jgi:hypothetical protein
MSMRAPSVFSILVDIGAYEPAAVISRSLESTLVETIRARTNQNTMRIDPRLKPMLFLGAQRTVEYAATFEKAARVDAITLYHNRYRLHVEERAGHDGPVLVKEPDPEASMLALAAELQNEFTITTKLADVSGVRRAIPMDGLDLRPQLILDYVDGRTLAETISNTALTLMERVGMACSLAAILSEIHDLGIMHRDVCSDNILVAEGYEPGALNELMFIDFGRAATMRQ